MIAPADRPLPIHVPPAPPISEETAGIIASILLDAAEETLAAEEAAA